MATMVPPSTRFRRVDAIFDAVLDLPDHERTAFIERACGVEVELRDELLQLLAAHRLTGGFLESPVARLSPLLEVTGADVDALPDRIGAFRVVRPIGHGGMGQVLLGERADGQFEQRVALKLIRHPVPGLVRRFLEERRILALLEHPHIARLIDGGITDGGLPYFAMEFVEGQPIDRYCASRELSIDDRIALFTEVCEAVSYAHHHLVIHRDLKPSNILVTPAGQVKLLDFGIAKLLGGEGASVDETRTELRAMTPEFAAPEQVCGGPVSTATDVYSLGVLLYLLLTGKRPYDLRGRSAAEIERTVCELEPVRPSATAPVPVHRRLRGDLDLIVMTALQKHPERRYQSPAALAADLQRFRQGHAILARPDSAAYRLRKFVGRHRSGVAATALLALALAGGASRERLLRHRAEVQARKAMEVEKFLVGVFDVADPNSWSAPDGGRITARELLDRGASRIDSTLAGEPEVQAELRSVLGRVYTSLGLFDKATPMLERSLAQRRALHGPRHTSVARDMDLLGAALAKLDRHDEAEPLLREALGQRRRLLGNWDGTTAESIEHLATLLEHRGEFAQAEPLYREVLAIRRRVHGEASVEVARSLSNLGLIRYQQAAYVEAESLYRRALAIDTLRLGESHALTAATMQNLAQTLQSQGRLEEAETFHRRALAAKRKTLGSAHPSVTISLNNLANLLTRLTGRLDEAEALAREALALDRQLFGETHSYVAESMTNVGLVLRLKGDFVAADTLFAQALAIHRTVFGEPHGRVGKAFGLIAQTRYALGDGSGAVDAMRRSLAQYQASLGDTHRTTTITTGNLGFILAEFGDPVEAESLLRASSSRLDPENAGERVPFISNQIGLGKALLAQGRADDALVAAERAVEMARRQFGEGNYRTGDALLTYGSALAAKGRYPEAERALLAARTALEQNRRAQPLLAAKAQAAVARLTARPIH